MLPCFLKIKCTNEVVDDLNFSDLNAWLVLVRRVNLGDINFIHKLPENGSVKLLHIGVLSDRCNELSDVDFLLLLFLDFLPQMFDKICKVGLFQLIVTGQFDETLVGELAGNVTISYKNKQRVERPESERFVVKNTHEALVTQEQWDIVQEVRQHKKRVPKHMEEPNIFSGMVFCADCGKPLVLHRASTMERTEYNFKCYTYGKKGKTVCTPHHIREFELKAVVLEDLRRVTHFARMKEKQFAAYISSKNTLELRREMNTIQKDLDTMRRRREELSKLFKRLYEDNVLGRVTDEQYRMLAGDYTVEQKALEEQIPEKEARLEKLKAASANVNTFVEKAKQYTAIDELTPELLRLFIQRIEVGERTEKYSRSSHQSIRIVYRDIGTVDSAMEQGEAQPRIAPPLSEVFELPA